MHRTEYLLVGWTVVAAAWWGYAAWLVRRRMADEAQAVAPETSRAGEPPITVFKPLAGLRTPQPPADLVAAVESFVAQLHDGTELLLGVENQDTPAWQPVFESWRQRYPAARVAAVCQPRPATFLNPRSSWWHELARRATGRLWLWSDADIVAPPGLLATLRQERADTYARLVTSPYVVRQVPAPAACWEALFVNVEFYPGVMACRAWGWQGFAFGAGMFFAATDFQKDIRWDELGARLAEDSLLGRRLTPVHVSRVTVEALAAESRWSDAVFHYLRWQKTVRWLRPAGYGGQIVILPVLGWLAAVAWQPLAWWTWAGLVLTMQMETLVALWLCARVGCRLRRYWWVVEAWSVGRALTWLACWLPWPVVFRSQRRIWWSLYRSRGGKS